MIDLARFVGEYGTPESERARRTIWVFLHCNGHLVAGATSANSPRTDR